ncbi:MAG: ATP synthase F1 subunit delta [Bacteroidales bacterium]|nr:ATP synthase F1 subunit delta [Bacteroidales bacterium]
MNDYRINISYAKALLMTADEKSVADRVADYMRLVSAVCRENRVLTAVFANPVIRPDRKAGIVRELFGEHCNEVSMAFLLFVVKKNRSVNLRGISEAYLSLYRESRGIVLTDFVTYQPTDEKAHESVKELVEKYTGKKVELNARTDERMLGGFRLEFDHNMYDARLLTKIMKLRKEFSKNIYESKF